LSFADSFVEHRYDVDTSKGSSNDYLFPSNRDIAWKRTPDHHQSLSVHHSYQIVLEKLRLEASPPSHLHQMSREMEKNRGKNYSGHTSFASNSGAPSPSLGASANPPTGYIACIFTDIIDSTNLWEQNPKAMWEALQIHDELMRRNIFKFKGYEVKTAGDSFFIAFSDAAAALQFCLSVQISLPNANWPKEIIAYHHKKEKFEEGGQIAYNGLNVRMGLHYGKPYVYRPDPESQRMDYFGPMVNTTARVQGKAEGGQIAVSDELIWELGSLQERKHTTSPLDNATREEILLKELKKRTVGNSSFKVKIKGWRELKGVKKDVYITLIRW
jgi:class 3 adenylate cyclase